MKTTHWEVHYSVDGVTWWRLYYGLVSLNEARNMVRLEEAASAEHYTFKIFRVETTVESIEETV
jgi:hypothetical protein